MNDSNFVKIDRKILDWEWCKNRLYTGLFVHCLLKANPETGSFKTTLSNLANELGYSVQNVRTAIKCLIADKKVTNAVIDKYHIITVYNYDKYLIADKETTRK